MKRITAILLITMLAILPIFSMVSMPVSAKMVDGGTNSIGPQDPGTWPYAPGTFRQINWKNTLTVKASFYHNDYYEHGGGHYEYEYPLAYWKDGSSLRIWIMFNVTDYPPGGAGYFDQTPEFRVYQDVSWMIGNKSDIPSKPADTGWIKADESHGFGSAVSSNPSALFSTVVNANEFRPGLFRVDIRMYHTIIPGIWIEHKTVCQLYGLFTWGDANVADVKGVHDDVTGQNYATMDLVINSGKWHVEFWYVDNPSNMQIMKTKIKAGPNTHEVKDFGYFDSNNPPPRPLRYNFTDNDSAGVYVWLVYSVYNTPDGEQEVLYSWTATVHNNKPNNIPETDFKELIPHLQLKIVPVGSSNATINGKVIIQIKAWAKNASVFSGWFTVFYSMNEYMAPDPATSLVQYDMYPISLTNNVTYNKTIQVKHAGQLNVWVIAKNQYNSTTSFYNITRGFVVVQDFKGGSGGGDDNQNDWFSWPWQSTANMVILLIGVIAMFSRRPTWQMIGILLFFLAFVNWTYAAQYIQHELNPLHMGG